MTPRQARALLALLADLYLVAQQPDPQPAPADNGADKKQAVKT